MRMRMICTILSGSAWGRVIVVFIGVGHFRQGVFGVAGGPLRVVKVGLCRVGAGCDSQPPVVIQNHGRPQTCGVEDDRRSGFRHLPFGGMDFGMVKLEAGRRARMSVVMCSRDGRWVSGWLLSLGRGAGAAE